MKETSDGGYIICGGTNGWNGDVWLIKIVADPTNVIKGESMFVSEYKLSQNYPNPFNPVTHIKFSLPKSSYVILKIYNILGEEVTTLVSERLAAGKYTHEWDATGFSSGVYLYLLETGKGFTQIKKLILLK